MKGHARAPPELKFGLDVQIGSRRYALDDSHTFFRVC